MQREDWRCCQTRSGLVTLREHGFRFILRKSDAFWVHPSEMQPGDRDCTDMSDAEFESAVYAASKPIADTGENHGER